MFDWKGKYVLVTGGAGLIGSYMVEQLVKLGAFVSVIDDLSRGTLDNLKSVIDRINFVQADLRLFPVALEACKNQDVVMSLASPSYGVAYSSSHQGQMLTDTTRIGFNVLDAARLQGAQKTLVVSSSCVYPDDAPVPTPEEYGHQDYPEHVNRGYGWAKRMIERQAMSYHNEYDMDVTIARPFNTYGPRVPVFGDDRDHVLIALLVKALSGDGPLKVWGSGKQARAFLHAEDVATLLIRLTEKHGDAQPTNVGSHEARTMSDIANLTLIATQVKSRGILYDPEKLEGATTKCADSARLNRILSDRSIRMVPLEYGIEELAVYVREQLKLKCTK